MDIEEEKNNRRRALISTLVIHGALFILFLFVGLTYYDPKPEDGILINFGDSETGFGEVYEAPSSGLYDWAYSPASDGGQLRPYGEHSHYQMSCVRNRYQERFLS